MSLTSRQRISVYLAIAALIALACGGINYDVDANKIDGRLTTWNNGPITTDADCGNAADSKGCQSHHFDFVNDQCTATGCALPPDRPKTPITNCGLGKTNGGVAWTLPACKARTLAAGCTQGTLYSFGCQGYYCTNLQCGQ